MLVHLKGVPVNIGANYVKTEMEFAGQICSYGGGRPDTQQENVLASQSARSKTWLKCFTIRTSDGGYIKVSMTKEEFEVLAADFFHEE